MYKTVKCIYNLFMIKMADRFKKARKKRGLSQEKLAQLAGVTRRIITHYETDSEKPTIENLKMIANALHVPIDYLVNGNDQGLHDKKINDFQMDSRTAEKVKMILNLPRKLRSMVYIFAEALMARQTLQALDLKNTNSQSDKVNSSNNQEIQD